MDDAAPWPSPLEDAAVDQLLLLVDGRRAGLGGQKLWLAGSSCSSVYMALGDPDNVFVLIVFPYHWQSCINC